ncbi:CARDB domain-containing protein [Pyrococcus kukulkanii]|uniref:CARDB domain-containing protein n=1 Tax=Pyrococcus kukulkanii TaxID=1609559 RepID=UPI0035665C93
MVVMRGKLFAYLIAVLLTLSLAGNVMAMVGYNVNEGNIQLWGGTFRDVIAKGDSIPAFAILWKMGEGPLPNETVIFKIYDENWNLVFEKEVKTNEDGLARVDYVPKREGLYRVIVSYGDMSVNSNPILIIDPLSQYAPAIIPRTDWIFVNIKNVTPINLLYGLMDTYTRTPYSGQVNLTLKYGEKTVSVPVNVTDGIMKYTLDIRDVFPEIIETGGGNIEVYINNIPIQTIHVADPEGIGIFHDSFLYEGENTTVLIYARDVSTTPYTLLPLNETIKLVYYLKNGSIVENVTRVYSNAGYYLLNITDTQGVSRIDIHIGDSYYKTIFVAPRLVKGIPDVKFEISPKVLIAQPNQTVEFEVRAIPVLSKTVNGSYQGYVEFWKWDGTPWFRRVPPSLTEAVSITFNGSTNALLTIKVPSWAHYGRITLGSTEAFILVPRPKLDVWGVIPYSYDPINNTFIVPSNIPVSVVLREAPLFWFKSLLGSFSYEYYSHPLPNETVVIFSEDGILRVATDENGIGDSSMKIQLHKDLPLVAGVHAEKYYDYLGSLYYFDPAFKDVQSRWIVGVHASGANTINYIYTPRNTIAFEINGTTVHFKKYAWNGWWNRTETDIPVLLAIVREGSLVPVFVKYWNTSELTVDLSPGVYRVVVFPNERLSWSHNIYNYAYHPYETSRTIVVLPSVGSMFEKPYYKVTPGYVKVPVKLPPESMICVLTDSYIDRVYCTRADETGSATIQIYVPPVYGLISDNVNYVVITKDGQAFLGDYPLLLNITGDVTPPTISAKIEPEIQEVGKNVTIKVEIVDYSGIDSVSIQILDLAKNVYFTYNELENGARNVNLKFNFQIPKLSDYILFIRANDTNGNSGVYMVRFFSKITRTVKVLLEENSTAEIDTGNNVTLAVAGSGGEVDMNVTVASTVDENESRIKLQESGVEDLIALDVKTSGQVRYNWVILNVTYDEDMLERLGIKESDLTITYWNGSEWIDLKKHVGETIPDNSPYSNITIYGFGIDTEHNYVWANVSHLSLYSVAFKLPDLKVEDVSGPSEVPVNSTAYIYVTIKNDGGAVDKSFNVSLYVNGSLYEAKIIEGLGSGEETTVMFKLRVETLGDKILKVIVDDGDRVYESNEDNNEMETFITVVQQATTKTTFDRKTAILALIYYYWVNNMFEEFEKLYKEAIKANVSEDIIEVALKYRDEAFKYYEKAIKAGKFNYWTMVNLRHAYIKIEKAIEILEKAKGH